MEQRGEAMVTLLHDRKCPFDYQCLSNDCMECVKIHMEKGCDSDGL